MLWSLITFAACLDIYREIFFNMVHIVSFSHLSSKTEKPEAPATEQVDMNPITNPRDFNLRKKRCYFTRKERQALSADYNRASSAGLCIYLLPWPCRTEVTRREEPQTAPASHGASLGLLSKLAMGQAWMHAGTSYCSA